MGKQRVHCSLGYRLKTVNVKGASSVELLALAARFETLWFYVPGLEYKSLDIVHSPFLLFPPDDSPPPYGNALGFRPTKSINRTSSHNTLFSPNQ